MTGKLRIFVLAVLLLEKAPELRFHIPLIEPDMQISRIRLSDKTSRFHPRQVVPKPGHTTHGGYVYTSIQSRWHRGGSA